MKIVRNTGTERVVDLLRPSLTAGRQLDVVTPSLSVFAFSELQNEVASVVRCRLLLPPASTELAVLGSDADRAARNRLQTRWLAERLSQWLTDRAEVRRAPGAVPQGAFVLRDGEGAPPPGPSWVACLQYRWPRVDSRQPLELDPSIRNTRGSQLTQSVV